MKTINNMKMKKKLKRLFKSKSKQLDTISCSFYDGETVMYDNDKVKIQRIYNDWATIKFDDGYTMNVGIDDLCEIVI